jgi:hypothetical protein
MTTALTKTQTCRRYDEVTQKGFVVVGLVIRTSDGRPVCEKCLEPKRRAPVTVCQSCAARDLHYDAEGRHLCRCGKVATGKVRVGEPGRETAFWRCTDCGGPPTRKAQR